MCQGIDMSRHDRPLITNPSTGRSFRSPAVPRHELVCRETGQRLRQCQTCKERKPAQLCFGPDKRTVDGLSWHCNTCTDRIAEAAKEDKAARRREYQAKYAKTAKAAQAKIIYWEKQVAKRQDASSGYKRTDDPKENTKLYVRHSIPYAEAQVRYWNRVWEERYSEETRRS